MTLFCPKCGSLMKAKMEKGNVIMICPRCGHTEEGEIIEIREKVEKEKDIEIIKEDVETLPIVNAICPKCGNDKAYFWTVQTRAADEPETRFYRCTKCGYTWREYE